METNQPTAVLYRNHLKGGYSVENGERSFIITRTSCFFLSEETLWLIKNLPEKGGRETFGEALTVLGLNEPQKICDKIISIGILEEFHPQHVIKTILKWLIRPDIKLIPAELQARFVSCFGIRQIHDSLSKLFYPLVFVALVGLLSAMIITRWVPSYGSSGGWQIFLLIVMGSLIHELGHSVATSVSGVGLRPIGFSVYLFYPVFYTNVSGMDKLNLRQKLAIDCGGLISQSLYLLVLCILALKTGNHIYLESVKWILLIMTFNINPFLKTDGYWVYNDIREQFSGNRWVDNVHRAYLVLFIAFSGYLIFQVCTHIGGIVNMITAITQDPARLLKDGHKIVIGVYFAVMAFTGGLRRIQESRDELTGAKSAKSVPLQGNIKPIQAGI
jgi:hypothetical protein